MSAKLWSKENGAIGFSSVTNTWATPNAFFMLLDHEFNFTLDPCASSENTKCAKYYTEKENGLTQSWQGETVFMNPPYGRDISKWLQKAYEESKNKNTTIVCLIPARTDTKYWHDYVMKATEVRLVKGRLKFGESNTPRHSPRQLLYFTIHGCILMFPRDLWERLMEKVKKSEFSFAMISITCSDDIISYRDH